MRNRYRRIWILKTLYTSPKKLQKKNYFLRLNQRKVKYDGIRGRAVTESEYWREEKVFSQPCLPTTEATTVREVESIWREEGKGGREKCGRTILRWEARRQVSFLHSSKIPLDPFLRLPRPHPQRNSPCFSSPWAPSEPVQTLIHTDPCLLLISQWDAPGRPPERSLKKALSIALEGRDSGRAFLRISSQWLLQASSVWALLKVFHLKLKKAMLPPGFYEW